jgi:hypothetical protein
MSSTPPPLRLAALAAASALAAPIHAQTSPPVPPAVVTEVAATLTHEQLERELDGLARGSGGAATSIPLGVSRAGRAISALRIARGTVSPGRPAILVVAALDGELA